jgi:hypothetical protein
MVSSLPILCRRPLHAVALHGFNMAHTIAQSAGENNARVVNCGEIGGEQATAGKDWD